MHRIIAMLVILLVTMPALEVIKHEAKSGYDKFVLTMPITRSNIVQSHYFFYILIAIIGSLLSFVIFSVYSLISDTPINSILRIISFGVFIVLFAGAVVYPLLYIFGPEKSDSIVIGGAIGGLFATFGLQGVVGYIVEQLSLTNLNVDPSLYISLIYTILGVIVYILSYFVSVFIYRKKEF